MLALTTLIGGPARGAPLAAVAATEPEIRVGTCGEPAAALVQTVSRWLIPLEQLGVRASVVVEAAGCTDPAAPRPPGTVPADVLVQEWRGPGSDLGGGALRTRVSFVTEERLTVEVSGRKFSAALASRSLDFPTRSSSVTPESAAKDEPPPEGLVVQGIVALTAYRRRATTAKDPGALAPLRERAYAALEDADRPDVELFTPETSAVLKQLRALLLLEGTCSSDTAAGLLRAASRLLPHDAEARAAAAIGRLAEGRAQSACSHAVEQEFLHSLALDRWNAGRVDDLGRFYELSMNAASSRPDDAQAVTGDVAAQRLVQVWESRAPEAPMALELAASLGVSKSGRTTDLLRTVTPAFRFDATLGRDSRGFGFRIGATLPWTRELPLGAGTVSWTRLIFSAGPRYRDRIGRFYWEVDAALLVAPAFATGNGFDTNFSAFGLDGGAAAGARVGVRLGQLSVWLGGSGSYFAARYLPGWPDLTLNVMNVDETSTLPSVDVAILAGLSQMFWR